MNTDLAIKPISRSTVIKVFAALAVVAFLLRIFYAGHLYEDDGLWFTAGEELLRGKALYREIYFDKPPVLPLLYALLFKLFGVHILTIRLFTIFYSVAVGFTLYRFAAFLYDKRTGLFAAAMFVFFSTTYLTGHFQGLNTDFLMTLPYALSVYWFIRSFFDRPAAKAKPVLYALAAGIMVGIAFQTNPKAIFNLLFFVLCSVFFAKNQGSENESPVNPQLRVTLYRLLLVGAGFLLGALPFWIYLAATHSINDYRQYVWEWGTQYAAYFSLTDTLLTALRQSLGYFAVNNTLLIGLLFVVATVFRQLKARYKKGDAGKSVVKDESAAPGFFRADAMLLLWFLTSYAGMSVGGRFYGHYFFQILPGLCLLGGRGITGIFTAPALQKNRRLRYAIFTLLIAGFLLTLVRFHTRTAILARDWARGTKSELAVNWNHERLNREERLIAAAIKDLPDDFQMVEHLGIEGLRTLDSQKRDENGTDQYLFVWGYRPEIYFWSGRLPASRFLSSQPLTGVPADVHYFQDSYISVLDEKTTAAYRRQLLSDLQATRPVYIIDELGFFNDALAIKNYPELKSFLAEYKLTGARGRFLIYYRPKVKNKSKDSSTD